MSTRTYTYDEWIPMRLALADDPRVAAVASATGRHACHVIGALQHLWALANKHSSDGHLKGWLGLAIDRRVGIRGFCEAMVAAGWLEMDDTGVRIPRFEKWNSEGAKGRARERSRKAAEARDAKGGSSVSIPESFRDPSGDLPASGGVNPDVRSENKNEKKEKDKEPPLPPVLDTPDFVTAWADWRRHRTEIRKPLKPTQVAAQLRELAAIGEPRAVAMIRHTIAMGWQGLRAPEAALNGSHARPAATARRKAQEAGEYD